MGRVSGSVDVTGATADQGDALWHDTTRWPAWVEGFGHVARADGSWPSPGSTLVWDSAPGGRGRVLERVAAREPGMQTVLEIEDERMTARQSLSFEPLLGGVCVVVEVDYELKQGGALRGPLDVLFVRRMLRESLRRTLTRFAVELAEEATLSRDPGAR